MESKELARCDGAHLEPQQRPVGVNFEASLGDKVKLLQKFQKNRTRNLDPSGGATGKGT